ncbi:MAG: VIT1/CCC1 transporter family protein [Vulcanisaeta sp.]|jgi:VIT1/CCC1 family predicted Fe2+/Mn2+ transporter|uniref:VIT1/CCC1 transporter family protein n=1 Tax=Vulcanisaeta sp. TaxID=2020871 RepID=UPI003D0E1E96
MELRLSKDEVIENYKDELTDAEIYAALAKIENNEKLRKELLKLSQYETSHAEFWRFIADQAGIDVSNVRSSRFSVMFSVLIRRLFGLGFLVKLRESAEVEAIERYGEMVRKNALGPYTDRLREILLDEVSHEEVFKEEESRFEAFIDNIRDAMYGMSDGLVEVLAAVAGLAPVVADPILITLAGLIVGTAGTLSMAVGAYMSTKAQRDIRETMLSKIDIELENLDIEDRTRRVKNALNKMGIGEKTASEIAPSLSTDVNISKRITEVSEIGLSEEALENPGKSALYTGIFYLIGALLVIAPFPLLGHIIGNVGSLYISIVLVALAQAISGLLTAISGSGRIAHTMAMNILLSLGAAAATYTIGTIAHQILHVAIT